MELHAKHTQLNVNVSNVLKIFKILFRNIQYHYVKVLLEDVFMDEQ